MALAVAMTSGACAVEVPRECAATARMPVPVVGEDMVRLQAIADAIARDPAFEDWAFNMVDADEGRGTVVVGIEEPSVLMCLSIHARFGPLIEVVRQEPYVPL